MGALMRKIRSERGASITFALLLFLVCAIISSVVIVAATAAAGRVSQVAELDQKYYAVNSAAELIQDLMEQHTVEVTTGTEKTDTATVVDGTVTSTDEHDPTPIVPTVKVYGSDSPYTYTYDDTYNKEHESMLVTFAKDLADPLSEAPNYDSITLTAAGSPDSEDTDLLAAADLSVTFAPILDKSHETLTFTVYRTSKPVGDYTLTMTFKANKTVTNDKHVDTTDWAPEDASGTYTRTVKTTDLTITTVNWKLASIETVGAKVSTGGGA